MLTTNLENLNQAELDLLLGLVLAAPMGPAVDTGKLADKIRDAQTNLSQRIALKVR